MFVLAIVMLLSIICSNGIYGVGLNEGNDLFDELWQNALSSAELNNLETNNEKAKKIKIERNDEFINEEIKREPISEQFVNEEQRIKTETQIKEEAAEEEEKPTDGKIQKGQKANGTQKAQFEVKREGPKNGIGDNFMPKESDKGTFGTETIEKVRIVNEFLERRKESKNKNENKKGNYNKNELKIAKELGESLKNIYKWKKEFNIKANNKNDDTKLRIVNEFDNIKNSYKVRNAFKKENRVQIEKEITKELGTYRDKIYEWKRQLALSHKWQKTKTAEKRQKPKQCKEWEEGEKMEIIEKYDEMIQEYKDKKGFGGESKTKIECAIAKQLGTSRAMVYEWKREFFPSKKFSDLEKAKIIEHFHKVKEQFSEKFKMKVKREIEEKIARKFGCTLRTIYTWKKKCKI